MIRKTGEMAKMEKEKARARVPLAKVKGSQVIPSVLDVKNRSRITKMVVSATNVVHVGNPSPNIQTEGIALL